MSAGFPPDPELDGVVAAFIGAGAAFVVIGGFAVIAHRYVRATEDVDLMIPDDDANDARCLTALREIDGLSFPGRDPLDHSALHGRAHLRSLTARGLVDLVREGDAPLDFATVRGASLSADLGGGEFRVAGLSSLVAMKRLAGRPRDLNDLAELEAEHGELPIEPIPGLDDPP